MATWLPLASTFTGYAGRYVDPALSFALGWNYWFKYTVQTPNNLTAGALVLQYWVSRETVNPGVFIAVFLVTVFLINYFGVKYFGEVEFWLSSIKIVVIVALMILSIVLAAGGGPNHVVTGFHYWNDPGAFAEYISTGATGRFFAFWSVLTTAVFAFLGSELVGVTVGECANPRKVIPRAIRLTFYRILVFYVGLVLLLGLIIPYNSPQLATSAKAGTSAAASPFVAAIQLSGIKTLPAILNGAILIFVLSAANSGALFVVFLCLKPLSAFIDVLTSIALDLYTSTRTLYALAVEGNAPKIFTWTNKSGIPVPALVMSSLIAFLAFLNVNTSSSVVFTYFVNLTTIFGLLTWISILVTHISFIRARKAQDISDSALVYVAPLGIYGSYCALFFAVIVSIFKGFNYFTHSSVYGNFDYKNFITAYLGIPLYLIMILGFKFTMKSQRVRPEEADFYGGKARIDREEEDYLEKERIRRLDQSATKWERVYDHTIGILF